MSARSAPDAPAARQVVLLCDGTNNNLTGGLRDTNVVKLGELLAAHPEPQRLVYYDPGVGNVGELPGATLWDQFRRRLDRLHGLAFGRGVYENMAECYLFLMRHYRPGDELYIIGFSRGAFTARSVAGLINQFGILQPHMESMLPTLLHVYFSDRGEGTHFNRIAQQITRQFSGQDTRAVDVHFVGVWDTVAAVGLPPFDMKFTALPVPGGKRFVHVRQALALDEHRRPFQHRLYAGDNGPFTTITGRTGSLCQLWFPGAHGDVGGGYDVPSSALSDIAFAWLVKEAVACGLRLQARGEPLDTEDRVLRELPDLHTAPAQGRAPRRHSELREKALWAVAGICVRDTNRVVMDNGSAMDVKPEAHPVAAGLRAQLIEQSSGPQASTPLLVWVALLATLAFLLANGQTLHGAPASGSLWGDLQAAWRDWRLYLEAGRQFQWWQLSGWLEGPMRVDKPSALAGFASPRWALVWDLGLIVSYAVVLSWCCARAFHRVAGLRRVGDPPRRGLNVLGLGLTLMVFADVAENGFTWTAITLAVGGADVVGLICLTLAAVCAVAKWVGAAGVVCLVAWGLLSRRRAAV